jgi:eukaryotic-like serine/threonine-protein kinase
MTATPAHVEREPTPTPTGSRAGHDLQQARLSLFFGVIFAISLIFFALHNTLEVSFGNLTLAQVFALELNHWHLTSAFSAGALWLLTRSRPFGPTALAAIDALGSLAVLSADYMMGSTLLGVAFPHFDLVLALVYVQFQMTRAVIVPSTVRRTIAVCTLSAAPLLFICWLLAARAPDAWSSNRTVYAPLYVALWCLESAIPAAIASSVIYGLRQQVRKASQLGQYTLEERLGEGGMGAVYRARHAMLRRPTAVKLLKPERTGEAALLRFEREVQLTSRLTHPNTVAIYDYGRTADGIFYYVMEYLDGLDLQRMVELDGPQDPARTVHILSQVCRALNEAHGLGLIHRDIKPANIIMCERGAVPDVAKVVDFGLVKTLGGPNPSVSTSQTIIGTPHYLSPEAIRSAEHLDARSDLYGLGAVGYFLLTGRHVFEGESVIEICGQHLRAEPVRPSERAGRALPPALEDVMLRCLNKQPEARPQSALALADELRGCGVPEWSEEQARRWWARRSAPQLGPAARSDIDLSPTLLEIDVRGRVRSS